jgi:hypothetical protein
MKIRPVGADMLHTDGRTDTTELTVSFENLRTRPKMGALFYVTTVANHFLFFKDWFIALICTTGYANCHKTVPDTSLHETSDVL